MEHWEEHVPAQHLPIRRVVTFREDYPEGMLQEAQLDEVVRRRPSEIAEMRAFLSLAGIPVLQASALPAVVARVGRDRAFRRDLTSHLWVWMAEQPELGYAEQLAMLAVAAAGAYAWAADEADAHALLRLLIDTRRAFTAGVAVDTPEPVLPVRGQELAAPVVPERTSARVAVVAGVVLLLLVLASAGWWLRQRTAALPVAGTTAPVESGPAVTGGSTASERKPDVPPDAQPEVSAERGRGVPLARGSSAQPRKPIVAGVVGTGAPHVDRSLSGVESGRLAEPAVPASVPPMPSSAAPTFASTANLPQVVARPRSGVQAPVPAGVLSSRLGARTLPAYTDSPEYSGPWRPRLLRRTPATNTQVAELQPMERPGVARTGTSPSGGTVRPTALGMMAGNVVYSPSPAYPSAASQARVQGEVRIEAQVDRDGNVSYARVVSGPPLLREAALDAVQHWRFKPWVARGKTTPMTTMAVLAFELP